MKQGGVRWLRLTILDLVRHVSTITFVCRAFSGVAPRLPTSIDSQIVDESAPGVITFGVVTVNFFAQ
jgi:hypothetical protein